MKVSGGQQWTQTLICSSKSCGAELEITAIDVFYQFAIPLDGCQGSHIVFCGACASPVTIPENVLNQGVRAQALAKSKIIRGH